MKGLVSGGAKACFWLVLKLLCTHTVPPPPIPLIGCNREMEADDELINFVNTVSEKLETKTNKGHKLVIHICIYIKLLEFNY